MTNTTIFGQNMINPPAFELLKHDFPTAHTLHCSSCQKEVVGLYRRVGAKIYCYPCSRQKVSA